MNEAIYLINATVSLASMVWMLNRTLTPRTKKWINAAVFVTVTSLVNYLAHYSETVKMLVPDFRQLSNIKLFGLWGFWILFIAFFYKDSFKKKGVLFLVFSISMIAIEFTLGGLMALVFKVTADEVRYLTGLPAIAYNVTAVLGYWFAAFCDYRILTHKKLKLNVPTPALTVFILIMAVNVSIMSIVINSKAYSQDRFTHIALLAAPALLLILSALLFWILRRLNDQEVLKEKLYWSENVKALELDYYTDLQNKTNEVRKIRHDFKDHLESIRILLKENTEESNQKAHEILNSLDESISATKIPVYTENIVVNTIVGIKAEQAKNAGIDFKTALDIPKSCDIESIDLNCVFLNMLNNAIESCEKLPPNTDKYISLKAFVRAGFLFVKVENPCGNIELSEEGTLKTKKDDKTSHGFGISLIKDITQKYNGSFEAKFEDGVFSAVATMCIKGI